MKIFGISLVLLTFASGSVAAQEALHVAKIDSNEEGQTLAPLVNRNGWVNPEDLIPMPQCIAQQDQSSWLSAMTKCTSRRCTSHFGVICTHHQWLTQLSCLSIEFSSDMVRAYVPYCSRSVLSKAQLFRWIHTITGRTWLVEVGDANGLQTLSPASLAGGYAAVNVINKAPTCLTNSASALSMEPFQYVMASCGFTSNTRHTGNAARPWEYSESLRSIIALDFETAGYDITQYDIQYGDYFDKRCFCEAFSTDLNMESCPGPGLASTRERVWLNATCGSTYLPDNWTDGLQTTTFSYIPTDRWHWPNCVTAMPKKVIGLTDRCTADACELDSSGYCNIKRAVDRACFCRNISYNTCKGSCHVFETRIDYVEWLHDLCGSEHGWHGLPKHWRLLADPTPLDMIPWRWSIKPFQDSTPTSGNRSKSSETTQTCASTEWKLGSLVLINMVTLLAGVLGPRTATSSISRECLQYLHSLPWLLTGLLIVALHLCSNWLNAVLVQSTLGYEDVSIIQMVLLWCSMPRFTWLTALLVVFRPFHATSFFTAGSCLFAEVILQVLSAYHMITAVNYGWEHSFYSHSMARLEKSSSARYLYTGALMWLVVIVVALVLLLQAIRGVKTSTRDAESDRLKPQMGRKSTLSLAEELTAPFKAVWAWLEEFSRHCWFDKSWDLEETMSTSHEEQPYTVYGTLPSKLPNKRTMKKGIARLFLITITTIFFLWIAQWLFWLGFIGLSMEEFCPPRLGLLTFVWMISSLAVATVPVLP